MKNYYDYHGKKLIELSKSLFNEEYHKLTEKQERKVNIELRKLLIKQKEIKEDEK